MAVQIRIIGQSGVLLNGAPALPGDVVEVSETQAVELIEVRSIAELVVPAAEPQAVQTRTPKVKTR